MKKVIHAAKLTNNCQEQLKSAFIQYLSETTGTIIINWIETKPL